MHPPLVSVVLCSYNGATFIREQVESLLKQTYNHLEIVVSDDASTDGTQQILEAYRSHPAFKIFLQKKTLGPIENVAFALQQTTGAFVAFCDQDDIWLPHKIETLSAKIGDDLLVYSDSELVDESGRKLHKKLSQLRKMYTGNDTRGFVFSNVVWGHTVLISRRLVPHLLPIPDGIAHDIWMALKAATLNRIVYVDEPLTLYRQHAQTLTKTIAVKTPARTVAKRHEDFKKLLHWMATIRQHERMERQPFYDKLMAFYARKENGGFQWPLFQFMLKHRKALYQFSQKGVASQVVNILKHARGITL